MEEVGHIIEVLEKAKKAIKEEDVLVLRELSNQTIHTVSTHQDTGNITMAIIIYALSKVIERKSSLKIKNWNLFIKRIETQFDQAAKALKEKDFKEYEKAMQLARKAITSTSLNIRPYIQDVMRKAAVNKASKIYEHGISLGQTAEILGLSLWELSEYTGQTRIPDVKYNITEDVKKRAKTALEFFS